MLDPFVHFLGVDRDADAMMLLGLDGPPANRAAIEAALQRRLEEVFNHPDGRSAEADDVRHRLRRVASMLIARGPRASLGDRRRAAGPARVSSPGSGHALTEFDRSVLAILVGTGGWNSRSRALLVAHAAAHQVTPAGLMKVIRGLGDYARAGGAPIPAAAIAVPARSQRGPFPSTQIVTMPRPVRIDSPGDSWPVVRLSILFGLITILGAVLVLRSVFTSPVAPIAERPQAPSPVVAPVTPPVRESRPPAGARVARFRSPPTFLGNALPKAATDAADECPRLTDEIDRIIRKLSLTDEPSESVFHQWTAAIDTIATGWVLVDDSTRRSIERGLILALAEAGDTPTVSDRLLDAMIPARGRLSSPLDVWRGAYLAARLGGIIGDGTLPPAVIERARSQLAVALGDTPSDDVREPRRAADLWLRQSLDGLVELTEIDPRVYDYWESWMAAQRKLGDDTRLNDAWLDAVDRLLATDTDLGREGPSLNVLGRLLTATDFSGDPLVRSRVTRFFDDQVRVTSDDLWILTSLLAQLDTAPWFTAVFVLPHDADAAFRRRIRDRLALAWPPPASRHAAREAAAGRGVPIEEDDLARWTSQLPDSSPTTGDQFELMQQLLAAASRNEAATLFAARRPEEARAILQSLAPPSMATPASPTRPRLSGGPPTSSGRRPVAPRVGSGTGAGGGGTLGPDGVWAASFEEARRNTQERLDRLRQLRRQAGRDLGPIDAEAFVSIVYRGSPQDVRTLARDIVIDQFTSGPNVAIELLDQLPDAPRHDGVSEIVHGVTGHLLPPVRHPTWLREARLALVEHALTLRTEEDSGVDDAALELAEIYARRRAVVAGETTPAVAADASVEAGRLVDAWARRAGLAMSADPFPDDIEGLRRRRAIRHQLASGPIQRVVADALATLDHLAYIVIAEQPSVRDAVALVLADGAERRQACAHVLAQAVEAEVASSRIWALRFQVMEAAP